MKLSKTQQAVVDAMRDGWEMGTDCGPSQRARIQKNGLGRGGEVRYISSATFNVLFKAGVIIAGERKFPVQRWLLAEGK